MTDTQDPLAGLGDRFSGMDEPDEDIALQSMHAARDILKQNGLGFGSIMDQVEARNLLLPHQLTATIRKMDSTTNVEDVTAFRVARLFMRRQELSFKGIFQSLEQEAARVTEITELQEALSAYHTINNDLSAQNQAVMEENAQLRSQVAKPIDKKFDIRQYWLEGALAVCSLVSFEVAPELTAISSTLAFAAAAVTRRLSKNFGIDPFTAACLAGSIMFYASNSIGQNIYDHFNSPKNPVTLSTTQSLTGQQYKTVDDSQDCVPSPQEIKPLEKHKPSSKASPPVKNEEDTQNETGKEPQGAWPSSHETGLKDYSENLGPVPLGKGIGRIDQGIERMAIGADLIELKKCSPHP